jgi:FkbM family methyltransferase
VSSLPRRLHLRRLRRVLGGASCVSDPWRFVRCEFSRAPTVVGHRLRGSRWTAQIRHPLLDLWVLEEIFRFGAYEPPPAVRDALAECGEPLRVLDLGGHVGLFGLWVLGLRPDAEIVSFEPDPRNAGVLARCVEVNRLGERWTVVPAAAATADGSVAFSSSFHLSRAASPADDRLARFQSQIGDVFPFLSASGLLEREQIEVECRDALPFMREADLIKIDIEGGEWELLADPRVREAGARAIVLESHPVYAEAREPERALARLLADAGYEACPPRRSDDADIVWALRPASS